MLLLGCLLVFLCDGVNALVHLSVGVGEGDATACHHALGNGEKSLEVHFLESGIAAALHERRHEIARESAAVNVHAHAKHGGGVDHTVYARFAMVAHNQSHKLAACALKSLRRIVPEFNFAIVVFEVRRCGAASEVAPFAYHGIADEAIVRLVAVTDEYGVLHFATHFAEWAESGAFVDFRTDFHFRVVASRKWATNAGALHNLHIFADVDRTFLRVEESTVDACALFYENLAGIANYSGGVGNRLRLAALGDEREIVAIALLLSSNMS